MHILGSTQKFHLCDTNELEPIYCTLWCVRLSEGEIDMQPRSSCKQAYYSQP